MCLLSGSLSLVDLLVALSAVASTCVLSEKGLALDYRYLPEYRMGGPGQGSQSRWRWRYPEPDGPLPGQLHSGWPIRFFYQPSLRELQLTQWTHRGV
ncbi:uncharacterized protein B0T15DRAFT_537686 [Chaetomium strumarium]|uniref:Uncharacterized protein n=1 Tax=Chaetomium strumarium TaxID=1170767 RepID=A0AAJ0M0X4_9PEZI|nr:hypothetical protein B0T15DRAFT_537686 [Chaetomium strumarium]